MVSLSNDLVKKSQPTLKTSLEAIKNKSEEDEESFIPFDDFGSRRSSISYNPTND